jgi:hypothetical protein
MTISALATLAWARWLHGAPALGRLLDTSARALLVAVPAAAPVRWLVGALPGSTSAALLDLVVGVALFTGLSAGGIALVGDEPMRELLRRVTRRVRRSVGAYGVLLVARVTKMA